MSSKLAIWMVVRAAAGMGRIRSKPAIRMAVRVPTAVAKAAVTESKVFLALAGCLLSRSTQRAMTLTVRTEVVKQCSSASCVVTW